MIIKENKPPRVFRVGRDESISMRDCASITLEADEQVTFAAPGGVEYDVARKSWGFYATPSLNRRVPHFGLRGALVRNTRGHYFVVLVESARESEFVRYKDSEGLALICWLDDVDRLARLEGEPCRA